MKDVIFNYVWIGVISEGGTDYLDVATLSSHKLSAGDSGDPSLRPPGCEVWAVVGS